MFNKIFGILSGHSGDSIYVQTGGIEWDILVPSRSLALFGPVGEETQVYTWLHHLKMECGYTVFHHRQSGKSLSTL